MRVTWGWAPTPRDELSTQDDRAAVRHTDRHTNHHKQTDHRRLHEGTTDHV